MISFATSARIDAGAPQAFDVSDLDAVDVLHGQDAPRAVLPVDARHADVLYALEVGSDSLSVAAFVDEIELARDHVGHLFGDEAEVQRLVEPVEDAHEDGDVLQVGVDQLLDVRVLHLDGDDASVVQHRLVHLGQRRGGDWLRLEALEHGLERLAQLALDHAADGLERLGRQLVLQLREHVDVLVRQDVGP